MSEVLVKVCGATRAADLTALHGVDLVGLWWGVRGGHADLSRSAFVELAARGGPEPVMVTFADDVSELARASGVRWVQLHGFQSPKTVGELKEAGLTVVKALHFQDGTCVEGPLVGAYERAGADMFVLDRVGPDGALGSTGKVLSESAVLGIADRLSQPFLLSGGVSPHNADAFRAVRRHPRFVGVDVDTGCRDRRGRIDRDRVGALVAGWRR
ncbi:phosphoribosylanthranilate isomerase [Actinokineospora globicatena]|uniref:N-(5'-phosphoribosyl)anthranilate isomerase n=1 Tax=Actinokineospora globicatena TaxID=103729 RepID=A0A9W6V6W8_9PSEU|nr:hypothetical protein [Actinokineospora globicatena]GLW89389.1 N-(5'-phosphoribosyl)anthranilate isomerase [Actinokineospora globicatena]